MDELLPKIERYVVQPEEITACKKLFSKEVREGDVREFQFALECGDSGFRSPLGTRIRGLTPTLSKIL